MTPPPDSTSPELVAVEAARAERDAVQAEFDRVTAEIAAHERALGLLRTRLHALHTPGYRPGGELPRAEGRLHDAIEAEWRSRRPVVSIVRANGRTILARALSMGPKQIRVEAMDSTEMCPAHFDLRGRAIGLWGGFHIENLDADLLREQIAKSGPRLSLRSPP